MIMVMISGEVQSLEPREYMSGTASLTYSYSDLRKSSVFNTNNVLDLSYHNYLIEVIPTLSYQCAQFGLKGKLYLTYDNYDRLFADTNELYMTINYDNDNASVTIGERREVWGNGITWNPANIMTREVLYDVKRQRNRPLEAQKGRIMIKNSALITNGSYEMYLLPMLVDTKRDYVEGMDVAAKFNYVFSNVETNVAAIQTIAGGNRDSRKSDLSLWASYAFPNNITVFLDQLISFHNRFIYPSGENLQENTRRQKRISYSTLEGASYRQNETVVRLECYYNGFGYDSSERRDYLSGLAANFRMGKFSDSGKWLDQYEQYLLSRYFVGLSLIKENLIRDLDLQAQIIYGIEDSSYPLSGFLTYHLNNRFDATVGLRVDKGATRDAEFDQQITTFQLFTGVTWHF